MSHNLPRGSSAVLRGVLNPSLGSSSLAEVHLRFWGLRFQVLCVFIFLLFAALAWQARYRGTRARSHGRGPRLEALAILRVYQRHLTWSQCYGVMGLCKEPRGMGWGRKGYCGSCSHPFSPLGFWDGRKSCRTSQECSIVSRSVP